MAPRISPLAVVDPRAELANDVHVGPFCTIGPNVRLGPGCRLDSHVVLTGHTEIGSNNRFHPNSVIGGEPQDYSYTGSATRVIIGNDNIFREGVTVSRGAEKEDHVTRIGNANFLMANSHVAHNCVIHNQVVLVNGVLLGGHVHVFDGAIISGNTVVHHFTNVGTLAFVTGGGRVVSDVPPYMLADADCNIVTLNLVGLRRKNIGEETIKLLKRAHRKMYREMKSAKNVRAEFELETPEFPPELHTLLDFIDCTLAGKAGRGGETRRTGSTTAPAPEVGTAGERRAA